jgi:hypothetical protein
MRRQWMAVIMSLKPVAKRRFDRRRKLLPRLKLNYPSENEMQKLATLASIDDSNVDEFSVFAEHIRSLILDAHLNDSLFREFSTTQIRTTLDDISKKAQQLGADLKAMDVGGGGSAEHAGQLLEWELSKLFNKRPMFLREYIAVLGKLNDAAKGGSSSVKTKRGQRNLAFNQFVEGLLMAAEQRRGHWTIYRAADQEWTGTLLEALTILQQYLPPQFFPDGELGRSIEHVRSKLEKHITKNEGS